jgi:acyl carrier protein
MLRAAMEEPMKTTNAIVRNALAHHLDLDPSTIEAWQHLELDLYLSPHDILVVAHELEEVEDIVLAVEQLESMATVGDLQSLLSRAVAREKPAHSLRRVA